MALMACTLVVLFETAAVYIPKLVNFYKHSISNTYCMSLYYIILSCTSVCSYMKQSFDFNTVKFAASTYLIRSDIQSKEVLGSLS